MLPKITKLIIENQELGVKIWNGLPEKILRHIRKKVSVITEVENSSLQNVLLTSTSRETRKESKNPSVKSYPSDSSHDANSYKKREVKWQSHFRENQAIWSAEKI